MKRIVVFFLMLAVIPFSYSQKATISISHTVTYDSISVLPDSILITNMIQGGDTTLYGADTILVLDYTTGLNEYHSDQDALILTPSYPNPFMGQTYFDLIIPEPGQIFIQVYDVASREIADHSAYYPAGNHQFSFTAGGEGFYFLYVTLNNKSSSIKMCCKGGNYKGKYRINYLGSLTAVGKKLAASINSFIFLYGDELRSIVYFQLMSDTAKYTPTQDTIITINFQSSSNCPSSFVDIRDNHVYTAVQIGTQCWMAENLAYLPSVSPSNTGSNTTPLYYVYDYQGTDVNAAKATPNYLTYGVLYNWPAAMAGDTSSNNVPSGVQGVCPSGWHLPSDEEWKILEGEVDSLYGYPDNEWDGGAWRGADAGGNLKEKGTTHWNNPNTGATNSSGFNALPGGARYYNGPFYDKGVYASFWTTFESSSYHGWYRNLSSTGTKVYRGDYYKENGFALRCIMD